MADIVIHGASSFVGKHFLRKLAHSEHQVYIIAREKSLLEEHPQFNIYRYSDDLLSVLKYNIPAMNPVFFDFAWYGIFGKDRNDIQQYTINIPLVLKSIELANAIHAKHWIGIGSQAEYGNLNKIISEDEPAQPTSLYGKVKLICSGLSGDLCKAYGMEHSWLRLFSVFGPEDNHSWFIPYLLQQMTEHKEINVTPAEQEWDYLFIDDMIDVLYKLIYSHGIGICNLGSGKSVPLKFIIEKLKVLTLSKSLINYGAIPYQPDQVMFMQADISKIKEKLSWNPAINMEEGLNRTMQGFKK